MGIFTGIGMVTPDASRYKKYIRGLELMQAKKMLTGAKNAIAFRKIEDPREKAHQKQTMFARGLGKSTIFDQDRERLELMQSQRNDMNAQNLRYAQKYRTMIKKKHHWEKISQYYEMIDGIIGLASGGSGSASMSFGGGGGAAEGGAFGAAGGSYYTGGVGAMGGGSAGAYYGGF